MYRKRSQSCGIHKGDFIKDRTSIEGVSVCVSPGRLHSTHWKFHYFVLRMYCMCAQVIHLLSMFQPLRQITLANVDSCCASECTSRCLIDCVPGQDEFIKNKKNTKTKKRFCPESSICCIDVGECGQERERWREGK